MSLVKAIPTTYAGVNFRSRLEAKWAAFFDLCRWKWEYEPVDLAGYIPDFVMQFPFAPVLVEIKPATSIKDLMQYIAKIEQSGWDKEAMVLGAYPFEMEYGFDAMGILLQRHHGCPDGSWSEANFHLCDKCKQFSVHHNEQMWRCLVNGCYDGDHYLLDAGGSMRRMWKDAGNIVQWRPVCGYQS